MDIFFVYLQKCILHLFHGSDSRLWCSLNSIEKILQRKSKHETSKSSPYHHMFGQLILITFLCSAYLRNVRLLPLLQSQLNKATHILQDQHALPWTFTFPHFGNIYNNMCTFKREGAHHMWSSTVARGDPKVQPDIHSAEHDSSNLCGVEGDYQIQNNLHCPIAAG